MPPRRQRSTLGKLLQKCIKLLSNIIFCRVLYDVSMWPLAVFKLSSILADLYDQPNWLLSLYINYDNWLLYLFLFQMMIYLSMAFGIIRRHAGLPVNENEWWILLSYMVGLYMYTSALFSYKSNTDHQHNLTSTSLETFQIYRQ